MSAVLSKLVQHGFEVLGPDAPAAILADAALRYNSTEAHNARAQDLAFDILAEAIYEHGLHDPVVAEAAADAGESVEEHLCGVMFGHDFPRDIEERDRCLCLRCGKDGDA